jgi:hypothetical protein
MAEGLTPDMFKGLMKQFDKFGAGRVEGISMLQDMFSLGPHAAEAVYGLRGQEELTEEQLQKGMATGSGKTRESEYLRIMETIKQVIAGVGGGKAFDTRAGIVGEGEKILKYFKDGIKGIDLSIDASVADIKANKVFLSDTSFTREQVSQELLDPLTQNESMNYGGSTEMIRKISDALNAGVDPSDIMNQVGGSVKSSMKFGSPAGGSITAEESNPIVALLADLILATKETTEAVLSPIEVEEQKAEAKEKYMNRFYDGN